MTDNIILYEDEFYSDSEESFDIVQLVIFRLANEWYAVDVMRTLEVVKVDKIVYLPSSPAYVAGIVNLRGTVMAVTDLKNIFGLYSEPITDYSRLVVIESGALETGLLADEVEEVVDVDRKHIDAALATLPADKAEYIEGEIQMGERLVGILNVDKILNKTT